MLSDPKYIRLVGHFKTFHRDCAAREGEHVSDAGDGDGDAGVAQRVGDPLVGGEAGAGQLGAPLHVGQRLQDGHGVTTLLELSTELRETAPHLHDDKHVVDADTEAEQRQRGVHRGPGEAEEGAEADGHADPHPDAEHRIHS